MLTVFLMYPPQIKFPDLRNSEISMTPDRLLLNTLGKISQQNKQSFICLQILND